MPAVCGRHMFRFIAPSYHRVRGASSMKDAAALAAKSAKLRSLEVVRSTESAEECGTCTGSGVRRRAAQACKTSVRGGCSGKRSVQGARRAQPTRRGERAGRDTGRPPAQASAVGRPPVSSFRVRSSSRLICSSVACWLRSRWANMVSATSCSPENTSTSSLSERFRASATLR